MPNVLDEINEVYEVRRDTDKVNSMLSEGWILISVGIETNTSTIFSSDNSAECESDTVYILGKKRSNQS